MDGVLTGSVLYSAIPNVPSTNVNYEFEQQGVRVHGGGRFRPPPVTPIA